jgi:flagellar biosynthesis protein FlhF
VQIHKYKAKTISEAILMVKNDLGPDAMILSSRKLNEGTNSQTFEIAAIASNDDTHISSSGKYEDVKTELMNIKEMIYILNNSEGITDKLITKPEALSIYAKLLKNGINENYSKMFLAKAGAFNNGNQPNGKTVKTDIIKAIMENIEIHRPFETKNSKQTITAMIGTTGVGKTTTIAKLAAQLVLKSKKKVGLISIDSYRIGAMEQLKTYANILGIPCFPAFNRKDLVAAIERLTNMDNVIIDTAGQSQYDGKRMEELKNIITDDLNIQSHLLLNIATAEEEMNKTAINFSALKFKGYIFTKLDESEKYGSIINQLMKKQLPISYLTTGQNVPDDIEAASKNKIAKLLFNKN